MNHSKKRRLKYVLSMACAWIGLYGVAILAMYTAGCREDGSLQSAKDDVSAPATSAQDMSTPPSLSEIRPENTPPATSANYTEAEALYGAGQYSEAAAVFAACTHTRPANLWGHYMLGLACWKSGDLNGAAVALEAALAIDNNHLKSQINLARVQLAAGDFSQAHSHALMAVALAPAQVQSHRILGRTFHNLGMAEEAINAYRSALAINAADAWSLNNIGLILIEEERFMESLGPLARAVEVRDDVAAFRNNLGVALERTGRYRAAAASYRGALEIEKGYSRAATSLARVEGLTDEMGLSQWDLALLAERFAQNLSPEAPIATGRELTEATPR